MLIYLDNAATTLQKPEAVINAMVRAMKHMGNAERGAHEDALSAARTVFEARLAVASLFGCPRADHVVFSLNVTEALNIALNGLCNPGDHVMTTDLEHNSVLRPLHRLERDRQVRVDFLAADRQGRIDYSSLEKLLRPETRIIVTTHASNLTGGLLDIARIGAFAKAHNLLYIVDAAQTAGSIPIDMSVMGIDVLCFTGHKGLMGPQGTGGLCVMPGIEIRPWNVGGTGVQTYLPDQPGEYPVRLEAGTLNGHGIAGLLAAVEYIREITPETIHLHEMKLTTRFYDAAAHINGVHMYGDFSGDRAPIVALNIRDYPSSRVADELAQAYGIAVRAGAHCAPRLHQALGTKEQGAVRFSFGWLNTEQEVDRAIAAVRSVAEC